MSKLQQIDDDTLVQRFFDHDYQDRGVVKWQGFYLSDHTAALKKQARQEAIKHPAKTQQSLEEMSAILSDAYANGKRVSIQLNTRNSNDEFAPDLTGQVVGYEDDAVYLADQPPASLSEMRHVTKIS